MVGPEPRWTQGSEVAGSRMDPAPGQDGADARLAEPGVILGRASGAGAAQEGTRG